MEFQVLTWHSDDIDKTEVESDSEKGKNSNLNFTIFLFGKDLNEKTYILKVEDFTPYFYIKLPHNVTKDDMYILDKYIRDNMWSKHKKSFLKCTFHKKKKFRDFDFGKKFNFARLVFDSKAAMRSVINIFQKKREKIVDDEIRYEAVGNKKIFIPGLTEKSMEFPLYENMIDPVLKFIHHTNIDPVGWINLKKYELLDDDE